MSWFDDVVEAERQGDALKRRGSYRQALGCYRRALALCPGEAGSASIERALEDKIQIVLGQMSPESDR